MKPRLDMNTVDSVSEQDRLWFEAHPGVNEYSRPYVQGEITADTYPLMDGLCDKPMMRVVQIKPGVRARMTLFTTTDIVPRSRGN